jgi:hypothetical protein
MDFDLVDKHGNGARIEKKLLGREETSAGRYGVNADFLPGVRAAQEFEFDHARDLRKNGEIGAHANVVSRMKLGSALADDDLPRFNQLAAKPLDPQALGIAVSAVGGAALSFFMSHD